MRLFFHGSKTEEDGRARIDEFALLRIEVVALSHYTALLKFGNPSKIRVFRTLEMQKTGGKGISDTIPVPLF